MLNGDAQLVLSTSDVCELLGWNRERLYAAVHRGQLPARRMGRRVVFLRSELEDYLWKLPHVARETTAGVA